MVAMQGNYDHPSYLTRQQMLAPKTTAGSVGTSTLIPPLPISALRVRAIALTAVTTASLSSTYTFLAGTSSIGQVVISTASIGQTIVVPDLNYTLAQGTGFAMKNSADTASTFLPVIEASLDPATTWSGPD